MEILKSLNWRYATKKFDTSKKLSEDQLNTLKESMRISASSYGLEPWRFIQVEDPQIRAKISEAAWGQAQILDSSALFVLANINKIDEEYVNNHLEKVSRQRNISIDSLNGFKEMLMNFVNKHTPESIKQWAKRQVYIPLGSVLTVAAVEEIDACPMEGFDHIKVDDILGLREKGLESCAIVTFGFRSDEDQLPLMSKVRWSNEEVFLKY